MSSWAERVYLKLRPKYDQNHRDIVEEKPSNRPKKKTQRNEIGTQIKYIIMKQREIQDALCMHVAYASKFKCEATTNHAMDTMNAYGGEYDLIKY